MKYRLEQPLPVTRTIRAQSAAMVASENGGGFWQADLEDEEVEPIACFKLIPFDLGDDVPGRF